MISNEQRWKVVLFISLGIVIGTAFCMKYMEADLVVNGQPFSILGLELFYDQDRMEGILQGLDERVRTILSYHLHFDFLFMAGIFPFIAALCVLAYYKLKTSRLKKAMKVFALLQILAWGFDIYENLRLLEWMKQPEIEKNELAIFHIIVSLKWIIAVAGILLSTALLLFRKKAKVT